MRKSAICLLLALVLSSCTSTPRDSHSPIPRDSHSSIATSESTGAIPPYHTTGYELRPVETLPYARSAEVAFPLDDPETPVDSSGVKITHWADREGSTYHPVNLAQYGLYMLESYRSTGDIEYLRRAEANAEALLSGAEVIDDALWFPYPFDYLLHGDPAMPLPAPWYSGMAQGQALSLFVRLGQETDEPRWHEHADTVFASYDATPSSLPWFANVDDAGNLWLDEYVAENLPATHVVNGHIYSAFGLYDYALATGNEEASRLFDGAATTIAATFDVYRVPGEASYYCAHDYCAETDWQSARYHRGVTRQLDLLAAMTGDSAFTEMATVFREDYAASGATE